MKKFIIVFVACLLLAGMAYAGTPSPDADNVVYIDGHREKDQSAPMEVRLVRYGLTFGNAPTLSSGDAVRWDVTSGDAITISACVVSNDPAFAGILVTPIQTCDAATVAGSTRGWGYICVRGYCLANMEAGGTAGQPVLSSGGAVGVSGRLVGWKADDADTIILSQTLSRDIGVILRAASAAGGDAAIFIGK